MAGETAEEEVLDEKDDEATEVEEEQVEKKDEIPVRGATNAAFARARIASKNAKKHFDKEGDEEELTESATKLIKQEVDRRVADQLSTIEINQEVTAHIAETPEDKKFAGRARKYMQAHPTLTVEDAFALASRRPAIDPEEKAKAEEKVVKASVKGGTSRPKEEETAHTEADYKQIYKDVKSGDPAKRATAMRKLGIK